MMGLCFFPRILYFGTMKQTDFILRFFLFCIFLSISAETSAQIRPPKHFVITHWGLDEGLPQSSVNSIIQSKDGYLWLATFGGLVRFDGVSFTVFDRSNSPGMMSDRCLKIFEDRDSVLWISTEQGLIRKDKNGFTSFIEQYGVSLSGDILQDKKGVLWVIGSSIYRYDGKKFTRQNFIYNDSLRRRATAGEGDFWAVTGKDVLCAIGGTIVRCFDVTSVARYNPWSVVEYPKGTVWIATNGSGILRYRNGMMKRYTVRDGLPSNNLQHLLVDNNSDVWGVGNVGAARLTGPQIITITNDDGLSDVSLSSFIQDKEGNYWAGTFSRGLEKIRSASVVTYGRQQGLREERVLSLAPRKNGGLLIGTNGGGDFEMTGDHIVRSKVPMYDSNGFTWSILEDSKGRVWGTDSGRILYRLNGKKKYYPGFSGKFLFVIYEDRRGDMWFGCSNGLFSLHDGQFKKYSIEQGLSSNDVRCIFQDRSNNLWIGTVNGLNRMRNGSIESFMAIPGLTSHYIRAIYQDGDGTMWFGSYGGGLIRYRNGTFTVFTMADGMFDNIISHIVEDDSGYFWMGSNRGIARVSRKELNEHAEHPERPLRVKSFGKLEGMRTIETNGGFQPSAVKDAAGKIYFPTVEGLAVVDPSTVVVNTVLPQVHIEQFFIDGSRTDLGRSEIPYDSSNIEIHYTALNFTDPSKVKFRFRIDGYHSEWIDAGTRRTAYFTQMPPGEYRFQVIASNDDGYWNEQGDAVMFTILPPFWMTWWFRSGVAFLSIGVIVWTVKLNEQRKTREKIRAIEKTAAVERERLRIAHDLHDELGARLTEIGLMTDFAKKGKNKSETQQHLTNIGATARGVIDSFREIVWAVNPQQDTLDSLIDFLEQYAIRYLMHAEIRCRLAIPPDIPTVPLSSEQRHSIFMAVKESLHNIVKHARATEVKFSVHVETNVVHLSIEDNGRGFSNTQLHRFNNGVGNMKKRIEGVGGSMEISSVSGKGTVVTFRISLRES